MFTNKMILFTFCYLEIKVIMRAFLPKCEKDIKTLLSIINIFVSFTGEFDVEFNSLIERSQKCFNSSNKFCLRIMTHSNPSDYPNC